jgi:hypothetical protein
MESKPIYKKASLILAKEALKKHASRIELNLKV